MSCKISLFVISEILGLFGNRFTAYCMYSCHRWESFLQQVQLLLSQIRRTFSEIFTEFLKSTQNFAHFEKKGQLHSLNILEVINPTNVVTSIALSSCFRTLFASKCVHGSKTLLEPALQHFSSNFSLI